MLMSLSAIEKIIFWWVRRSGRLYLVHPKWQKWCPQKTCHHSLHTTWANWRGEPARQMKVKSQKKMMAAIKLKKQAEISKTAQAPTEVSSALHLEIAEFKWMCGELAKMRQQMSSGRRRCSFMTVHWMTGWNGNTCFGRRKVTRKELEGLVGCLAHCSTIVRGRALLLH